MFNTPPPQKKAAGYSATNSSRKESSRGRNSPYDLRQSTTTRGGYRSITNTRGSKNSEQANKHTRFQQENNPSSTTGSIPATLDTTGKQEEVSAVSQGNLLGVLLGTPPQKMASASAAVPADKIEKKQMRNRKLKHFLNPRGKR